MATHVATPLCQWSRNMGLFKLNSFCIVTGASRGLGRETALQLAQGWSAEGMVDGE